MGTSRLPGSKVCALDQRASTAPISHSPRVLTRLKRHLTPLNARRSAADSWNITSRPVAHGFRSLLVDLDLATIEGHLLLIEPIERAAQRPLIDGRPYFTRRARTECIERLAITRERTLNSSGVGIDDRSTQRQARQQLKREAPRLRSRTLVPMSLPR